MNFRGCYIRREMPPHQLFVIGASQFQRRELDALDFFERVEWIGVDDDDRTTTQCTSHQIVFHSQRNIG